MSFCAFRLTLDTKAVGCIFSKELFCGHSCGKRLQFRRPYIYHHYFTPSYLLFPIPKIGVCATDNVGITHTYSHLDAKMISSVWEIITPFKKRASGSVWKPSKSNFLVAWFVQNLVPAIKPTIFSSYKNAIVTRRHTLMHMPEALTHGSYRCDD